MPCERPRPALYPEHQRFVTQFLATRSAKRNTKAVFTSARFTACAFKNRENASLVSSPLALDIPRLIERRADEAPIKPCHGGNQGREKKCQEEKVFYSKSYPLHAFQIALQQRVQSEDHIVAEALELGEDTQRIQSYNGADVTTKHG